ncbi:putative ubiquitin-conjugating enzyme E2 23 [Balamuthia mandrillaris]
MQRRLPNNSNKDNNNNDDASSSQLGKVPYTDHPQLFTDDLVCLPNKPENIGCVSKLGWQSDSEEDYSDSEEEPLPEESVLVEWGPRRLQDALLEDEQEALEAKRLVVVDRAIVQGDVVTKTKAPIDAQSGLVEKVHVYLDLKFSTGEQQKWVPAPNNARHVHSFQPHTFVVRGPLLGRVTMCKVSIQVQFKDGALCELCPAPPIKYDDEDDDEEEDWNYAYYPGMLFDTNLSTVKQDTIRWIHGTYQRRKHNQGRVVKVEPFEVQVLWVATTEHREALATGTRVTYPPSELVVLDYFNHAHWRIGDVAICQPGVRRGEFTVATTPSTTHSLSQENKPNSNKDGRNITSGQKRDASTKSKGKKKNQQTKKKMSNHNTNEKKQQNKIGDDANNCAVVTCIHTFADVIWQDSSREQNIASKELIPVMHILDKDFWPEDLVLEVTENQLLRPMANTTLPSSATIPQQQQQQEVSKSGPTEHISTTSTTRQPRVGVVKYVNSSQRTCRVLWLPFPTAQNGKEKEKGEPEVLEEVSFYTIQSHPDFEYRIGDIVLRLPQSAEGVATNTPPATMPEASPLQAYHPEHPQILETTTETPPSMLTEPVSGQQQAWVGELIDMSSGKLLIHWSDGTEDWVNYDEVYRVDSDDLDLIDADHYDSEDGYTDEDEVDGDSGSSRSDDERGDDAEHQEAHKLTPAKPSDVPEVEGRRGATANETVEKDPTEEEESEDEWEELSSGEEDEEEEEQIQGGETSNAFTLFAFLEAGSTEEQRCLSTHRFSAVETQPINRKKWTEVITKEWRILKRSLPNDIYVRGFANRMDLFKILIAGPVGTPYAYCPFIFDVQLGETYPSVPPKVHYCSPLNERFNPNLYETGKVCLSLLGTWEGEGVETWNPHTSNLLQVAVSIQGLILGTSEPYFLEAGYDKQRGTLFGSHSAKLYNESAFLGTVRTMIHLLSNPPPPFERLIRLHFDQHKEEIENLCSVYLSAEAPGSSASSSTTTMVLPLSHDPSHGFRATLKIFYPKLQQLLLQNHQLLM